MVIVPFRFFMVCCALLISACATDRGSFSMDDFVRVSKIDVHVHLNSDNPALIEQAVADGFRLITVNVDYPDFPPIAKQLEIAQKDHGSYPRTLAYIATFSLSGWDESHWSDRVIDQLRDSFAKGAVGVKVWKNIGMDFRDKDGQLVMIDDAKFSPIFEFVRTQNKVLMGHQGEPHNCWLPIDAMTVNNDKEYFREHPQYHMYLHPELPTYEVQMRVRDRMLDAHPKMKFMGAHMASLEWSLKKLGAFLDRYPNAVVDVAARMGQVQFQSNQNLDAVRLFFIKYQDRLLYGTDLTQDPGADASQVKREAHEKWLADWRYLNTGETQRVPELDAPVHGLALPRDAIQKIYSRNAERWFGTVW